MVPSGVSNDFRIVHSPRSRLSSRPHLHHRSRSNAAEEADEPPSSAPVSSRVSHGAPCRGPATRLNRASTLDRHEILDGEFDNIALPANSPRFAEFST